MRISDWSSDVCSSDLFPQTIGFVRNTLAARRCDLIIGVATTNELMQNTNPYYRSGYVIVPRPEPQLPEGRLDDPLFKALRVGMQPRRPVATLETGRAPGRERVGTSVYRSWVADAFKKKN